MRTTAPQSLPNLLPRDGVANYDPDFLSAANAARYFERLLEVIPWQQESLMLYGKRHLSPRLVCWFGDTAYKYSGTWHEPTPWRHDLLEMKAQVEAACGTQFNAVLANLYRDGRDSMGWHADDERGLGDVIASVSLGAPRSFRLRHRKRLTPPVGITLETGSLLIMQAGIQQHWQHAVPKTARPVGPRINLTFRSISG